MPQIGIKAPVLPVQRGLLGQQVQRALNIQNELMADPPVSLAVASAALGNASYSALNRLIQAGKLKVFRIGPRGKRRIRLSSLRALLAEGDQPQEVKP